MSRASNLVSDIDSLLGEASLEEKNTQGRYHINVVDHNNNRILKTAASTPEQIHSVLHRAAQHMKDGGMPKIRAKVHDTHKNIDYKHTGTKAADGTIHFDGPDPRHYAA